MSDANTPEVQRLEDAAVPKPVHPNVVAILDYFKWEHLKPEQQRISRPLADLAHDMANQLDGPELTAGLRKLMEAKDCFVRASLPKS